jgi:hypothetical protein
MLRFNRIDQFSTLSIGYNFRYAQYYWLPNSYDTTPNTTNVIKGESNMEGLTLHRDLYKVTSPHHSSNHISYDCNITIGLWNSFLNIEFWHWKEGT